MTNAGNYRNWWSDDEVRILEGLAETHTMSEISQILGRSVNAIRVKAG